MADLAARWGITANTVSRRLSFLGVKPERQGNHRYITAEQLALGDELQQHILSGKPQEAFPRADRSEGAMVQRRSAQVAPQVAPADQLAALAQALGQLNTPPADPLRLAKALAEAADLEVPLSSAELAEVTGVKPGTIGNWRDGHSPRPGFTLSRTKQGGTVWWLVLRTTPTSPVRELPSSRANSRQVGFGAVVEASYSVISCSGAALFDRNRIS
jgi:hypothetical protein